MLLASSAFHDMQKKRHAKRGAAQSKGLVKLAVVLSGNGMRKGMPHSLSGTSLL
jgi:hypothetical protein